MNVGPQGPRVKFPLRSGAGCKFVLSVRPPALTGIVLTLALVARGMSPSSQGRGCQSGDLFEYVEEDAPNMEDENEHES